MCVSKTPLFPCKPSSQLLQLSPFAYPSRLQPGTAPSPPFPALSQALLSKGCIWYWDPVGQVTKAAKSPQSLGRPTWESGQGGAVPPWLCSFSLNVVLPIWAAAEGSPVGPAVSCMAMGDIAPVSLTSPLFWSTEVCWVSFGPCHVNKNKCNNMHLKRLACLDILISFWFYRDLWGF